MRILVALSIAACAALAGCTNAPAGQSVEGEGQLVFNGASTGTHDTKVDCASGKAEVHVSANLGSGSLRITLKDGGGATVYTKSVSGPGQSADSTSETGKAGQWTLTASRSGGNMGGWSGQYALHVEC